MTVQPFEKEDDSEKIMALLLEPEQKNNKSDNSEFCLKYPECVIQLFRNIVF